MYETANREYNFWRGEYDFFWEIVDPEIRLEMEEKFLPVLDKAEEVLRIWGALMDVGDTTESENMYYQLRRDILRMLVIYCQFKDD